LYFTSFKSATSTFAWNRVNIGYGPLQAGAFRFSRYQLHWGIGRGRYNKTNFRGYPVIKPGEITCLSTIYHVQFKRNLNGHWGGDGGFLSSIMT
jgi:hypothetical protein